MPPGTANGDLLLAIFACDATSLGGGFVAPTWQLLGSTNIVASPPGEITVFARTANAEPANYSTSTSVTGHAVILNYGKSLPTPGAFSTGLVVAPQAPNISTYQPRQIVVEIWGDNRSGQTIALTVNHNSPTTRASVGGGATGALLVVDYTQLAAVATTNNDSAGTDGTTGMPTACIGLGG